MSVQSVNYCASIMTPEGSKCESDTKEANSNKPSSFPHKTITADNLPFNKTYLISVEQVCQLRILGTGRSTLEEFADSSFDCTSKGEQWLLERKPFKKHNFTIETPDKEKSVEISAWSELESFMKERDISTFALENLPSDPIGTGCLGQVYNLQNKTKPLVFKLGKAWSSTKMSETFYLKNQEADAKNKDFYGRKYIRPLNDSDMSSSFSHSLNTARQLFKLSHKSDYILSFEGIVYVKDLNQWGVVYERIEDGRTLYDVGLKGNNKTLYKTMIGVANGLQILDQHGHPETDVKPSNVMIRKDGTPVIIDLDMRSKTPGDSITSRQQFGSLLYRTISKKEVTFQNAPNDKIDKKSLLDEKIPEEIVELIFECWSNDDMEKVSWEKIKNVLGKHS